MLNSEINTSFQDFGTECLHLLKPPLLDQPGRVRNMLLPYNAL